MAHNELIQLPNKDLWRGYVDAPAASLDTEVILQEQMDPVNKAMANILLSSKGASTLTCVWCGQQGQEKWMRAHIKELHKANLNPATDAQVLAHELGATKAAVVKE